MVKTSVQTSHKLTTLFRRRFELEPGISDLDARRFTFECIEATDKDAGECGWQVVGPTMDVSIEREHTLSGRGFDVLIVTLHVECEINEIELQRLDPRMPSDWPPRRGGGAAG